MLIESWFSDSGNVNQIWYNEKLIGQLEFRYPGTKELVLSASKSSDIEEISTRLSWKEFEKFAETVFKSFGYSTFRNYMLRRPRAEIDLLATRSSTAFVVDCKHWKRTAGMAAMIGISERQIKRAQRIVQLEDIQKIIPVILTLHDEFLYILENGTPIVPIHRLSDFILNWEVAPNINVLSKYDDMSVEN